MFLSSPQPTPVILLKEGTDTSQGVPQLVSNINACQVIAEAVRTTLGPRGMDKLIVDNRGENERFCKDITLVMGRVIANRIGSANIKALMIGVLKLGMCLQVRPRSRTMELPS